MAMQPEWTEERQSPDVSPRISPALEGWSIPAANRWMEGAWRLLALPLVLLFAIPILLLFTRTTPAQLVEGLRMDQVRLAIWVSLRTTLTSLLIILILGTPLAYLMSKRKFRFKALLDALIDLPTLLPPSVAGVALLLTFGRRGPVGAWLEGLGIQVAFTQAAVVLAQVFIAAPFYVRAAAIGFTAVDLEIIQAAHLDGANRWQAFRYIYLPLSRSALLSGSMMSWARALGEFGATIIFAGNYLGRTQTMPTAIYLGFEVDLQIAITLSVILVLISLLAILLVKTVILNKSD
jgi:molybdate transport system permease protein